ncbi:hypothetical protein DERF_013498 [Dermatophagoides farinae]|uniref:Uncharacterized protein n=1 Tax=Dermatophagoides farinae TaxID=6954 RepID=A0A922HPN0_DERFA|nr:hypothetical protein DERF_013498 [Dermatophagoides farinae]
MIMTSPLDDIRKNVLGVVALWNEATFSLAKNVSGTHIFWATSAPTTNLSISPTGIYNHCILTICTSETELMPIMCIDTPTCTGGPKYKQIDKIKIQDIYINYKNKTKTT